MTSRCFSLLSSLQSTARLWLWAITTSLALSSCGGGSSSEAPNGPLPLATQVVSSNLSLPISIAFAPDGRIFFSEFFTGQIRVINNGALETTPFFSTKPGAGNEGLSGIALDPRFTENHYLYFFYTDPISRKSSVTRVTDTDKQGTNPVTIVTNIPGGGHNGGRLVFGGDNDTLYISTGDAGTPELAQDERSLAGKILKVNIRRYPFTPVVVAKGLRNPFGMTLRKETNDLYCSDNGPTCDDEVNLIVEGGNYGWSSTQPCGDTNPGFNQPVIRYSQSVAPTGVTFYEESAIPELQGELIVADFNAGYLRTYRLDESSGAFKGEGAPLISGEYGFLVDVTVGPDGHIYVATKDSILKLSK